MAHPHAAVSLDEKLLAGSSSSSAAAAAARAADNKPKTPAMSADDDTVKFADPVRGPNETPNGGMCCPGVLACCLSLMCPCAWCCGCTTLDERKEAVFLHWGKYYATVREPGCYCVNPFGFTSKVISTARAAIDLTHVKVADQRGNPLLVSGVVTYSITESRKAALDVVDVNTYIQTQALAVLKKVASMYPYEAKKEGDHSLKTEASHLRGIMIKFLQDRVAPSGVTILNFELTDLAYAPEIANAMLIRQQAEAMVDARKIIVEGAVQISMGALGGLSDRGIKLTKEQEAMMVTNLLIVICGDAKVQPTVNVGTAATSQHAAHAAPSLVGNIH